MRLRRRAGSFDLSLISSREAGYFLLFAMQGKKCRNAGYKMHFLRVAGYIEHLLFPKPTHIAHRRIFRTSRVLTTQRNLRTKTYHPLYFRYLRYSTRAV